MEKLLCSYVLAVEKISARIIDLMQALKRNPQDDILILRVRLLNKERKELKDIISEIKKYTLGCDVK